MRLCVTIAERSAILFVLAIKLTKENHIHIYLGYFVCVSVCHNCGTLCYSFSFSNQTQRRRDGGFGEGGIEMERYGKGQTGEGGCEYTCHCLSLN